jgi:excisionase family DNA binding protein
MMADGKHVDGEPKTKPKGRNINDLTGDTASPEEAAEVLGTPRGAVYRAIKRQQIPVIEIGRLKRIPTRWLREKVGAPANAA